MRGQNDDDLFDVALAARRGWRIATAIATVRRGLEHNPKNLAWRLLYGEILTDAFRFDEAEAVLAECGRRAGAARQEVRFPVLIALANLRRAMGRYADAADLYRQAAELMPAESAPLVFLGQSLVKQGRLEDASRAYEAAARLADHEEPLMHLGYVLRAQERYAEAIPVLERALAIDPDNKRIRAAIEDAKEAFRLGDTTSTASERV